MKQSKFLWARSLDVSGYPTLIGFKVVWFLFLLVCLIFVLRSQSYNADISSVIVLPSSVHLTIFLFTIDCSHFKVFTRVVTLFSIVMCGEFSRRSVKKTVAEVFSDAK